MDEKTGKIKLFFIRISSDMELYTIIHLALDIPLIRIAKINTK